MHYDRPTHAEKNGMARIAQTAQQYNVMTATNGYSDVTQDKQTLWENINVSCAVKNMNEYICTLSQIAM